MGSKRVYLDERTEQEKCHCVQNRVCPQFLSKNP